MKKVFYLFLFVLLIFLMVNTFVLLKIMKKEPEKYEIGEALTIKGARQVPEDIENGISRPAERYYKIELAIKGLPDDLKNLQDFFPKYINVFGVHFFATKNSPDSKVVHAANVLAQLIDNDEDGMPDNKKVRDALLRENAAVIMFRDEGEWERLGSGFKPYWRAYERAFEDINSGSDCRNGLTSEETGIIGEACNQEECPESSRREFDWAWEEILHMYTSCGYANAYPGAFGEYPGTEIANAMDKARGGHFIDVPREYPAGAWFTYHDKTCEYGCMITEYFYWALTSMWGAQDYPSRPEDMFEEWPLNTRERVRNTDTDIYYLLTQPEYKLPMRTPDGSYGVG